MLHGQKYPAKEGMKHKAVIEFLCQDKAEERSKRESNIMDRREDDGKEDENRLNEADNDDDDSEEDHSATGEIAEDGHGGTLRYLSFDIVDDYRVLSLEWRTKYACENSNGGNSSETEKSSHWGFFTWLIIM